MRWPSASPFKPNTASASALCRRRPDGLVYECRIWETGEVETRPDNWHDFFNALVWLSFPQTKIAVSASPHAAPCRRRLARRAARYATR
jgi:hypothetical protein